jgi:hypothetical protein
VSDCSCATSKLTEDRRPLITRAVGVAAVDTDRLALAVSTFDQRSPPLDPSTPPGLSIAHLKPFQRSYSPLNRVPESE